MQTIYEHPLPSWQRVWRLGVEPLLSTPALTALRRGLADDDPALIQGTTTFPPPMMCVQDWDVEAACALGYCGWRGDGLTTVGEVEEFFARMCFSIDQAVGEPAGCRHFLNWWDETPREELRALMLPELDAALARRELAEGRIV